MTILQILYILEIFGTGVFALTGAFKAINYELDFLGVIVLSIITGVGGGVMRDVVLGSTPVVAFNDQNYLIVCIVTAIVVFFAAPKIAIGWPIITIFDAIGLGLFASIGAAKGMTFNLEIVGVAMCAMLTSIGGSMIRDVLVGEIPMVLVQDFYATAAIIGSFLYYGLSKMGTLGEIPILIITAVFVSAIRFAAIKLKFKVPKSKRMYAEPSEIAKEKWKNAKRKTKL